MTTSTSIRKSQRKQKKCRKTNSIRTARSSKSATGLGASNNARVRPAGTDKPVPVNISNFGGDIDFDAYHPEHNDGPLHLVNACVNNTVDPCRATSFTTTKA